MSHRFTSKLLTSEAQVRAMLGEPAETTRAKVADRLNALTRQFIERAPFLVLSTVGADGRCDVSPRGDPPGFVRILDERALLIPERPGNRLADSLRNIIARAQVGLLFLVPGVGETLRLNGRAVVTDDQRLLSECAVEGKVPKLGILVDVEEVFTHCPKAFIRSDFWNAEKFSTRESLPSNGQIQAMIQPGFDAREYDEERAKRYARREGFY